MELQRLRSHVLALDALSSSGGSSSDEEREDSALLPPAADAAAAMPQQASQAATQPGVDEGTPAISAADSAAERIADTAVLSASGSGGARAVAGCAYPMPVAAEVRGASGAGHSAMCQLAAVPPLIRHGAGALAGLLESADDDLTVQSPSSPVQRYRQAMGLPQEPAVGGWPSTAGLRLGPSADGVQLQQRWLVASGRQVHPDERTEQPQMCPAEAPGGNGDSGPQDTEQPRPPTPPAARRGGSGAAPSAGSMRAPPAPPSLPQVPQLDCG